MSLLYAKISIRSQSVYCICRIYSKSSIYSWYSRYSSHSPLHSMERWPSHHYSPLENGEVAIPSPFPWREKGEVSIPTSLLRSGIGSRRLPFWEFVRPDLPKKAKKQKRQTKLCFSMKKKGKKTNLGGKKGKKRQASLAKPRQRKQSNQAKLAKPSQAKPTSRFVPPLES